MEHLIQLNNVLEEQAALREGRQTSSESGADLELFLWQIMVEILRLGHEERHSVADALAAIRGGGCGTFPSLKKAFSAQGLGAAAAAQSATRLARATAAWRLFLLDLRRRARAGAAALAPRHSS